MRAVSSALRVELARSLRGGMTEENSLALRLLDAGRNVRIRGLCECGATLDDPTSEICGPCGRDRGVR